MVFLTKNSRVAHLWSRTTLVKRQKKLYRKSTFSIKSWITSQLFNEKVNLFKPVMIKGGGINASIICIETLFLAEYCGFGWVVGIFFWVFWFCFVIARKTNFKVCRVFRVGRRPTTTPGKFSSDRETKSKYSEKNANYSAKCTILS